MRVRVRVGVRVSGSELRRAHLVEEVLVVLDDLDAHELAGVQVDALHRLGEGGAPQVLAHLVARGDERVDPYGEVLVLFEARPPTLVHDLEVERLVLRLFHR